MGYYPAGWRTLMVKSITAPADIDPPAPRVKRQSEGNGHAEATDAVEFGLIGRYPAGVHKQADMAGETVFQAGTGLAEPLFGLAKLMAATTEARRTNSQSCVGVGFAGW